MLKVFFIEQVRSMVRRRTFQNFATSYNNLLYYATYKARGKRKTGANNIPKMQQNKKNISATMEMLELKIALLVLKVSVYFSLVSYCSYMYIIFMCFYF